MTLHARDIEQDVRELSTLLGEVLSEQASPSALETVERVRTGSIAYRRGGSGSREPVRNELAGLEPETREVVTRAFTTYFELVNLAEERERVRAVRRRREAGTLADSLAAAVERLAEAGADAETVQRVLDDVLVQPTFTAHPTEARRKTIMSKLRAVAGHIETLDERRLTARERDRVERELEAEVTTLWQTPQIRHRRPEVTDEALAVQWYLENVLFDVVGEVYDELEAVLAEAYPDVDVPKLFEFRSWAGSDRDGNPYVTPEVTAETLERQRSVALAAYREELERLSGVLSQGGDTFGSGEEFVERLEADMERLPGVADALAARYPNEPYRQKLGLMRERLDRVDDVRPGGYDDADELLADVEAVAESLRADGAGAVAAAHVDPLGRQVDTFGFSLASLDVRDHRENHTETVAAVFEDAGVDYAGMDEDERLGILTEAILQEEPVVDPADHADYVGTVGRVLERFDALADWQREYGADAVDTYCISMTEEPSHVLEVLFLADQAGVADLPGYCGIDVVPLLETESALSGARRIMATLFENEAYDAALDARGDLQEVMLGYSDSNKENGFLAANWSLYRNQKRLAEITDDYGVELRLFHGRGGSISRGGGSMNEALLALPTETVTGQVKFTEQGEAIAEKYANPRVARRNLEQMLNAQFRARHRALDGVDASDRPGASTPDGVDASDRPGASTPDGADAPERPGAPSTDGVDASDSPGASTMEGIDAVEREAVMETAAGAARDAYRDLLETEGFVAYFARATPIRVIEDLNLGSRPASRTGERSVEDLRAIPWVFSWTQARCILPGWFGLGAGLEAYLDGNGRTDGGDGGDLETLRRLYEKWPFFRTTLDNAALSLARTDLEIAAEYAGMAGDLESRFFPRIEAEYERTAGLLLDVTGRERLPPRSWLAENLERRNPYVDPLNLIQVRLLQREELSPLEDRTLRLTVKGIAAGMKSTG